MNNILFQLCWLIWICFLLFSKMLIFCEHTRTLTRTYALLKTHTYIFVCGYATNLYWNVWLCVMPLSAISTTCIDLWLYKTVFDVCCVFWMNKKLTDYHDRIGAIQFNSIHDLMMMFGAQRNDFIAWDIQIGGDGTRQRISSAIAYGRSANRCRRSCQ